MWVNDCSSSADPSANTATVCQRGHQYRNASAATATMAVTSNRNHGR
jgi:hypothetical protein